MKLTALALIMTLCVLLGCKNAYNALLKHTMLVELICALSKLEGEIAYHATVLHLAFEKCKTARTADFFAHMAQSVERMGVEDAWAKHDYLLNLDAQNTHQLRMFAQSLGKSDRQNQCALIAQTVAALERTRKQSAQKTAMQARLNSSLGILLALSIGIILY